MSKAPVSVCIISGAEAHRIRRTLESVSDWATEIIIVLNEDVNDGTDTVAREFGAKIFREAWKGYAAQKNSAAEKAACDWLLGLDADEVVSPKLRDEIIATLAKPYCVAFNFPRCSFYGGRWIRHGDWYPDRKLRLVRRGHGRWEGPMLHEKLVADGPVGELRHDLLHYGTDRLEDQVQKALRYAETFAHQSAATNSEISTLTLLFRPWWRFCRGFFLKLGFLDGRQGLCISWMTAFYTFFRYFKAIEAKTRQPAINKVFNEL